MQRRSLNERFWSEYRTCFGCGSDNPLGLRLEIYEDDGAAIARWIPRPEYGNWAGIVHGGALTAALDEVAGSAAWLAFRHRDGGSPFIVTAEYTVRFRAPARLGVTLDCTARVTELRERDALVEGTLREGDSEIAAMSARFVRLNRQMNERFAGGS